jgi:hypothetical protein
MIDLYYIIDNNFSKILNLNLLNLYQLDIILLNFFEYASSHNLTEISPDHNIYKLNEELESIFINYDNSKLINKLNNQISSLKNELNFLNNVSTHPIYNSKLDSSQIENLKINLESKNILLNRLTNIKFIDIENKDYLVNYLLENKYLSLKQI